ncbi:MAG: tetratricopeptide repeat protein [Desulfopila sp.]
MPKGLFTTLNHCHKHIMRHHSILKPHHLVAHLLLVGLLFFTAGCTTNQTSASAIPRKNISAEATDTSCSYFYFLWGNTAEYSGRYGEALEAFEKAAICDPQADYIKERIPVLLIKLERYDEASAWLEGYLARQPQKTVQRFMLARLKLQEGKDDEAIELFRQALANDPGNNTIRLRLGILHAKKKEYDIAEKIFNDILKTRPNSYFATLYLARLYAEQGALQLAEKKYTAALSYNWSKKLAYEVAEFYNLRKDFSAAQQIYKDILARDDEAERAALGMVQTYLFLQKSESALQELDHIRTYTKNPQRIDLVRSQILINIGENQRAQDILVELLKKTPLAQARYLLGAIYYEQMHFSKALAILAKIPAEAKEYQDAVMLRVRILEEADRSEESIALLQQVLDQANTRIPRFYSLLAAIFEKRNARAQALEVLAEGIDIFPENEPLLYEYAILEEKAGNHATAMAAMEKILSLNINNADALNFIGYSWADNNINLDKAYEYIQKALELKPESGYIQDSLGWVYYRMQHFEKARNALQKAIELEPEDPYIYEHLGDTYNALGDGKKARQYLKKARELLTEPEKIEAIDKKINGISDE